MEMAAKMTAAQEYYSCVPPSRLAAGRAGGMRNNIFMFRVKIRSLRRSFQFGECLPLFS